MMMFSTIDELIDAAGGEYAIAEASKGSLKEIKADAVRRWPANGIHDVHWPLLIELIPGLSAEEIYRINVSVRAVRAESKRGRSTRTLVAGVA